MRRPLLLFLFALCLAISLLAGPDPAGLADVLLPGTALLPTDEVCFLEGIVTKVAIKPRYAALTLDIGSENVLIRFSGFENSSREEGTAEDDTLYYALAGRRVQVQGYLTEPDGRRNPGGFDYSLYLRGRRTFWIMDVSRFRLRAMDVERPVLNFLTVCKGRFYEAIRPYMGEKEFQICAGLLFGETSYMDEDLYEQFRLNGIAHVLAVSGLHVGLLYSLVMRLLGGRRGWRTTLAVLAFLFAYAVLSGFSVSVLRASVMISLNLLSWHLKRRYDMVCAASFTAILFLIINPWQLYDTGMQLSFCAAYSIGIAVPWISSKGIELSDKYKKRWILTLFEIFGPCLMLQLGMTPLILYHFLTISPIALLLNPPAIILAGLLLPAGLASFVVSMFLGGLPLAAAAGVPRAFAWLLGLLSDAGIYAGGSFYAPAPPLPALISYYLLFFWFFSETRVVLRRRRKRLFTAALSSVLAFAGCCLPFAFGLAEHVLPWRYDTHPITFLDVGQGDCIHIHLDGYDILVDGGGNVYSNIAERTLRPYLLKSGISHLDLALITHEDADHSLGIRQLAEIYDIDKCLLLGQDNEDCGIVKVKAGGATALLMADADMAREKLLCEMYGDGLECDIIKLGHHGSAGSTGEELLSFAKPGFAVISCGKNNRYGHPADRVIELLENSGIIYARTDESGAVYLKSSAEDLLVFENAAKDRQWRIQRTNQIQNTPQGP